MKNKKSKIILSFHFLILLFVFLFPPNLISEEKVYFNLSNGKVHKLTCHWGQKCTQNCSIITRGEAYRRGGIACKVCGG